MTGINALDTAITHWRIAVPMAGVTHTMTPSDLEATAKDASALIKTLVRLHEQGAPGLAPRDFYNLLDDVAEWLDTVSVDVE
jgi:hypothetical protein